MPHSQINSSLSFTMCFPSLPCGKCYSLKDNITTGVLLHK